MATINNIGDLYTVHCEDYLFFQAQVDPQDYSIYFISDGQLYFYQYKKGKLIALFKEKSRSHRRQQNI